MLIGTGFTSALAFSISVWLVFKHLLHYNQPKVQIHIVRIIIMIPVRQLSCTAILLSFHEECDPLNQIPLVMDC